jgi:hypothetical protein
MSVKRPIHTYLPRGRKLLTTMIAVAALVAGPVMSGGASAAPGSAGDAARVQQKVDSYLAKHPTWRQVSPNKILMDGGSLTVAASTTSGATAALLACGNGHLCIQDGYGTLFDYYYCGYYDFYGAGDGTFNNNQYSGTTARFYNFDGTERWYNTAKDSGTASWTPVWHIRPC